MIRRLAASCLLCWSALALAAGDHTVLRGVVFADVPMVKARVTVADLNGVKKTAVTDTAGRYALDISGLHAPLLVSAVEAGNDNCSNSAKLWAKCMGALLAQVQDGHENTANINPLTDKIVSDVAQKMKLVGPQQLVDTGRTSGIPVAEIAARTERLRPLFATALRLNGITDPDQFDPVTYPMQQEEPGKGVAAVLSVVLHNRGYDNNTGQPGGTLLLDISARVITDMGASVEPLDYKRARRDLDEMTSKNFQRVLIVGDSTASTYELARLPRMGWGQVFERMFMDSARVRVINAAKSGRSSRNFYNQGYFAQVEKYLQPGDVVLIQHGHNDENCNSTRKDRGPADVANTCTYPNDANGKIQGSDEMSFQRNLERYISAARAKGAIPVLMTPTTRITLGADKKTAVFPLARTPHITVQNATQGYAYVGNYSQTVRDTAKANQVPLIDIDQQTATFANKLGEPGWKDYWLAVDTAHYPYYKGMTGAYDTPDNTHYQEKGALAVAVMVAEGIRKTPEVAELAKKLK